MIDYFDPADQLHYFKVEYLLFMNQKLEDISAPDLLNNKFNLKDTVESLFKLFKINFYPDKYTKLFEESFDLDLVQDVLNLQELI